MCEASGRPRVLRVHTVSDTGYPYEIHHVTPPVLAVLPQDADPVADAEAAIAALSGEFDGWLRSDLARLDTALTDYREERGEDPTGTLWSRLHDLRGNAAMLGSADISRRAEAIGLMLERDAVDRTGVIAAVHDMLTAARLAMATS